MKKILKEFMSGAVSSVKMKGKVRTAKAYTGADVENLTDEKLLGKKIGENHRGLLRSLRHFGSLEATEIEEIAQEAEAKVVKAIRESRYTENGQFRAYLTRVAFNKALDLIKKKKRTPMVRFNEDIDQKEEDDDEGVQASVDRRKAGNGGPADAGSGFDPNNPASLQLPHYTWLEFKKALHATRSPAAVKVFLLRYRFDLKPRVIATMVNRSKNSVSIDISRIKKEVLRRMYHSATMQVTKAQPGTIKEVYGQIKKRCEMALKKHREPKKKQ
jgi:RNA polymerase sigma factor (sigma-70 family)